MTADRPEVSVIIPAFNAARFLAEAVASVRRQAHSHLEIIVVDDGSTDDTGRVAAGLGTDVTVVSRPNGGPAAARNSGLEASRGEVIAFLDADDLWTDDKLALQLPRLQADPVVEVVLGRRVYLRPVPDDAGTLAFEPASPPDMALNLNCALIRRRLFDRVGLLDESLRLCEDWDWFMRCRELGVPMLLHDEVVLLQRLHEANITRDRERGNACTLAMLKRSLDRRRSASGKRPDSLPPLSGLRETGRRKKD